jgi:hypothetical protein
MGAVDNIMAAVILMFILVIGALLYMTAFAKDTVHTFEAKGTVFSDDQHISNLNNIMKITEPDSGRAMGILLADAVYYRNTTPVINNKTINVTGMLAGLMNLTYGNRKYYLEVKPRIIEVSMNFVIDGSQSLADERQILAANLEQILDKVEQKLNETNAGYKEKNTNVIANVYVITTNANRLDRCGPFDNLSDARITCKIIDNNLLYLKNLTINTSNIFINNSEYNLNSFLGYYNMTPPLGYDWISNRSTRGYYASEYDYYEADWGYGTAYASYFNTKVNMARLTLIFPMSDELSTSSIATTCFNKTRYGDWVVCSLCDDNPPFNRSLVSVNKGILVAQENHHIINPIFSYSCDYDYFYGNGTTYSNATATSGWNTYDSLSPYTASFGITDPRPSFCDYPSQCKGCSVEAATNNICFHPNTRDEILTQMGLMANSTSGRVINLQNISTMDLDISSTISQNIDQYVLMLGEKNASLNREVIEVSQPLPNGQIVDIRLWVYKN